MNRENLIRLLLKNRKPNSRKTSRLNKDMRWIFENNRGLLFIYNVNNRRVQVKSRNISYKNNGRGIVSVKSGSYRVPKRKRKASMKAHAPFLNSDGGSSSFP